MMDRAEARGFGIALAGHALLLAAFSLGFANVIRPSLSNAPIEVSFIDDVAFQSAAPQIATEPPPPNQAPELGDPDDAQSQPVTSSDKAEVGKPEEVKKTKGSSLGDILKGIGSDPSPAKVRQQAGAVMNAEAMASIGAAILRQVQPCANQQVKPGPGAERIKVAINLRLNRDGSLAAPPRVVSRTGVDDENRRYAERVDDLAIATFVGCSPLRGLPDALYDVQNGWSNFTMNYKLPG